MRLNALRLLLASVFLPWVAASAADFDHAHTAYARVLEQFVSTNGVDYSALKARPADLNTYLDEAARVTEDEFKGWSEPQQLALLINLYNAATLRLVITHHPVSSIRKIGGWFKSPWELPVVRLWGQTNSLDWLEHGIIRPRYAEPRIHFAVVCAAKGCPPLRPEPFLAPRLEEQLDDQTRQFLAQHDKNRLDPSSRTLHLSPIFKWYREDFTGEGQELRDYVRSYFGKESARLLDDPKLRVKITDYDWSLNEATTNEPAARRAP